MVYGSNQIDLFCPKNLCILFSRLQSGEHTLQCLVNMSESKKLLDMYL